MESSSISFSVPKYAIKIYDLPIIKALGAKLWLGEKNGVPGEQSIARVSSKSHSRQLLESLDQSRSRQPTNFPVSISLGLETLKSKSRSRSR